MRGTGLAAMAMAAAVGMATTEAAGQAGPDALMERAIFRGEGGDLPYRLLRPAPAAGKGPFPLVVFLHGAGERGDDNVRQLVHGVREFCRPAAREKFPCFLLAPQCPEGQKWNDVDWTALSHTLPEQPSRPAANLLRLLDRLGKELPIDPDRVYLTGLSMGGYGTWDLAAREPGRFAALVPVCGGADEATAPRIAALPIWAFHGAKDGVVKPSRSRNMVAALKAAGGAPKYTEYPEVGHDSWNPAYADPQLLPWLFAQRRRPVR